MASPFSTIPIRSNGKKIYASWFNDIRAKLITAFGTGSVPETQITILDNQAGWQDVPGMVFDQAVTRAGKMEYTIYRTDGALERREIGVLTAGYKPIAAVWEYARSSATDDDALGATGDMRVEPGTGKVQYKSDSMGGAYLGKMRYKALITFDKET